MDTAELIESFTRQIQDKESEIRRLRKALTVIAEWKSHDLKLAREFGHEGVREHYRQVARVALTPARRRTP